MSVHDLSRPAPLLPLPPMGETASGRPWVLRAGDMREALAIAQAAGVEPPVAQVLAARGVTAATARSYLAPSLREAMPDPFVLADMEKATARLCAAVLGGEKVGVFGDYDVDGTTASSILKLYFDAVGAPLEVYLPDRALEGYGPSIEAFRALAAGGAKVIATVDCGASAHAPIESAAREGLQIVVFDHHLMNGPPPAGAVAVVNPNRADDFSGLTGLSAAGLALLAVVALNRALRAAGYFSQRAEPDLRGFLDLAALGLVCDVMPMTGLGRVIVAQGLKRLESGGTPGLAALGARAGVRGRPSTYHLGFLLGPRINAAGRIGHARLALELLTTGDPARRVELAERLHVMNAERQEIEAAVLQDALAVALREPAGENDVVVVAGQGWHPGVIGIVAGRLKESLDRPVVVVALDNGVGKGSGRSIAGVDLGAAIGAAKAQGLLISGGGHPMAAGLTIAEGAIDAFRTYLREHLSGDIARARAGRTIDIDAVLAPGAMSRPFADMIERAGPFGPGNPEPVFALASMRADFVKPVGKDHLSVRLVSPTGETVRGIAFRAAETPLGGLLRSGRTLHVAGKIRADDWAGGQAAQLQIADAALAL